MTHILAKDPSSTQDWWAKQRHHLYGYPSGTMHLQQLSKVLHWSKELPLAPLHKKISAVSISVDTTFIPDHQGAYF